ncbi:hypothetical protein GOBAR_AA15270 [Gossypium barbadense]|uniref:Uncharacterized protein n=1 Tax=Gossypium barbadense TaxID=3634 RepID=A0A2P5XPY9_GOSBA|nr:hypothetical protein GOBAR_AA15270 [Gossypium barbadense]
MAMETLDDEKPEEEEVIDKENKEGSEKQTHQKNQVKDTIDVDEPKERGDPLTAEELEEKERLLEEEHATAALQYFLGIRSKTALHSLLIKVLMPLKLIISVASRITRKFTLLSVNQGKAEIEAQILAAEAAAKMKAEVELKKQREREEKLLELHYKSGGF